MILKWLKKVTANKILTALEKIVTNTFIDKMNDDYIEIQKVTQITQRIDEIITANIELPDYDILEKINVVFPSMLITAQEIANIRFNKAFGLRNLDYKLIENIGSDFLNLLNRKNKDLLLEISIMENIVSKTRS